MTNAIKTVTKDVSKSVGNVATAATELTVVGSGVLKDSTKTVAEGVQALPGILSALWSVPKNSMVGYIKEEKGLTEQEARAEVEKLLPDSVADAIVAGSIGTGALVAALFEDDEDEDTQEK